MDRNFTKDDTLIAKGAALILMYIHHLYAFPNRILNGNYYNSFFQLWGKDIEWRIGVFGGICIGTFIFLSGYGTYKSYNSSNKQYYFIKKKLLNFYKIYWLVFAVFIPLGYVLHYQRKLSLFNLINNLSGYKIDYSSEWWFITPFIFTMIFFPLISKLYERFSKGLIVDIFLIITLAVIIRTIFPSIMAISYFDKFWKSTYWSILYSVIKFMPSFLSGYIFAKYDLFLKFRQIFKSKFTLLFFSFILLIIIFIFRTETGLETSWDYIYAPLLIISITNIINELKFIKKSFISIGKKSTYMWLMHSFFCYQYFQNLIYRPHNPLFILLWFIGLTYLISSVLEKLNSLIKFNKSISSIHNF